mmetsp:Transcript_40472/g.77348  ORF Transcript_40472/g.77348 Transcript_40472/m.77348 type:complete len:283 (-) Transcript_40472:147-995(-)
MHAYTFTHRYDFIPPNRMNIKSNQQSSRLTIKPQTISLNCTRYRCAIKNFMLDALLRRIQFASTKHAAKLVPICSVPFFSNFAKFAQCRAQLLVVRVKRTCLLQIAHRAVEAGAALRGFQLDMRHCSPVQGLGAERLQPKGLLAGVHGHVAGVGFEGTGRQVEQAGNEEFAPLRHLLLRKAVGVVLQEAVLPVLLKVPEHRHRLAVRRRRRREVCIFEVHVPLRLERDGFFHPLLKRSQTNRLHVIRWIQGVLHELRGAHELAALVVQLRSFQLSGLLNKIL